MKHPIFTEVHELFRQTMADFVRKELVPHAEEWERAQIFPREVFERMAELGLLGVSYPKEYGGQGADYLTSVIESEELGKCGSMGLWMAVIDQTDMATPPIFQFGTEDQKRRYLVPAIQGKKIGAITISEPNAGSDVAAIETRAKQDGKDWIINGRKTFITNGTRADFFVTLTRTSHEEKRYAGMTVFIIDKETPGFSVVRKLDKVGMRCSDTAEIAFDDCRVLGRNLLGELGRGFYHIMWELEGERIAGAAGEVGQAQVMLEIALQYAQDRKAFGGSLADLQVIRHKLADMATQLEAARQLVYYAAWLKQNGEPCTKEIAMARMMAADAAWLIADEAVQLHGGYGYILDTPIQRYWRDARLHRVGAGSNEIMKEIIAARLIPRKKR